MSLYNANPLIRRAIKETRPGVDKRLSPVATVFLLNSYHGFETLAKHLANEGVQLHGDLDTASGKVVCGIISGSQGTAMDQLDRLESAMERFNEILFSEANDKSWLNSARNHCNMGISSLLIDESIKDMQGLSRHMAETKAELASRAEEENAYQAACQRAEDQTINSIVVDLANYASQRLAPVGFDAENKGPNTQLLEWKKLINRCVNEVMKTVSSELFVRPEQFEKDKELFAMQKEARSLKEHWIDDKVLKVEEAEDVLGMQLHELKVRSSHLRNERLHNARGLVYKILNNAESSFKPKPEGGETFGGIDMANISQYTVEQRLGDSMLGDYMNGDRRGGIVQQLSIAITDYVQDILTLQANNQASKSLDSLAEQVVDGPLYQDRWLRVMMDAKGPIQKAEMNQSQNLRMG